MNMFAAHNKDEIIHKNPRSWNLFSRDSYVWTPTHREWK
jgi:hypothetical protein